MPEAITKKPKSFMRKLLPWLVVLMMLLCPLAICVPFYLQSHAIQEIENKGGVVRLDDEIPWWIPQEIADWMVETDWWTEEKQRYFCEVTEVELHHAKFSDDDFGLLSRFTNCIYINGLNKSHIGDKGLKHLRRLTLLKELTLNQSHVTDDGLAHISQLIDVERLELADTQVTDAGLRHLCQMGFLGKLDLGNTQINGSGFKQLSGLTNLTDLLLVNSKVNNAGLKHIGRLTNLSNLNLSNTQITDEGLKHLGRLTNLSELNLSGTEVSDDGLKHLRHLTSLNVLNLSDTQVSGSGLKHLSRLTNLNHLYLIRTKITGTGLEHLSKLSIIPEPDPTKKQEVGKDGLNIDLSESQINDDGLKHLSQLFNLRSLNLEKTQVSDAGLLHLSGLKNLRAIYLHGSKVTPAGINQLQQTLPDCNVSPPFNTTLSLRFGGGIGVFPERVSLTNFCLVISAIVAAICVLLFFTVRFLFFQSD